MYVYTYVSLKNKTYISVPSLRELEKIKWKVKQDLF